MTSPMSATRGLRGEAADVVLDEAVRQRRILLTADTDSGMLLASSRSSSPRVLILRRGSRRLEQRAAKILAAWIGPGKPWTRAPWPSWSTPAYAAANFRLNRQVPCPPDVQSVLDLQVRSPLAAALRVQVPRRQPAVGEVERRRWSMPLVTVRCSAELSAGGKAMQIQGKFGAIAFDGSFVTILHEQRSKRRVTPEKRIHVGKISAIQLKPARKRVPGFIQFSLAGASTGRLVYGSEVFDAANAMLFTVEQEPQIRQLRDLIEAAMTGPPGAQFPMSAEGEHMRAPSGPPPVPPAPNATPAGWYVVGPSGQYRWWTGADWGPWA